jgi:hypothetical protein
MSEYTANLENEAIDVERANTVNQEQWNIRAGQPIGYPGCWMLSLWFIIAFRGLRYHPVGFESTLKRIFNEMQVSLRSHSLPTFTVLGQPASSTLGALFGWIICRLASSVHSSHPLDSDLN